MASSDLCLVGQSRPESERGAFATTHWSIVMRAAQPESADGQAALKELCQQYWYPLYCFARWRCHAPQDAEDLTQGFFADLLARGAVAHADVARGRFRTFLLCSFRNFCSHERARAGAVKRGGGCEIVSLEAMDEARARFHTELSTKESAEQLFDRRWANSLIELSLARVRTEYAALGKAELFDSLVVILQHQGEQEGYGTIAARFGSNVGAIKVAMFRLRRRLGREIRAEVAKTVAGPAEVEDEMRHLLAAVQT
jgi:DNA-directed RNA polymerase specialized sigma24 family protein